MLGEMVLEKYISTPTYCNTVNMPSDLKPKPKMPNCWDRGKRGSGERTIVVKTNSLGNLNFCIKLSQNIVVVIKYRLQGGQRPEEQTKQF